MSDVLTIPTTTFANSPLDGDFEVFSKDIERRATNKGKLIEWISSNFREDVDYGSIMIQGRKSKPSLLKPGAEKVISILGLTAIFPSLKDYENKVIRGEQIENILVTCKLVTGTGDVVAEGGGARSVKAERGDLNKALKMALKSAQIDATLRVAGLSDMYTQDIEDMPKDAFEDTMMVWSEESRLVRIGFGKHKDTETTWADESLGYLNYFLKDGNKTSADMKLFIESEKEFRAKESSRKQAMEDEQNEGKGVSGADEKKKVTLTPMLTKETKLQIERMVRHELVSITFVNRVNLWLREETQEQARGENCISKMVEMGVPIDYDPRAIVKDVDEVTGDGDLFAKVLNTAKNTPKSTAPKPLAYEFNVKGMIECAMDNWNMAQASVVTTLIDVVPKKTKGNHKTLDNFDAQQCETTIKGILDGSIIPF